VNLSSKLVPDDVLTGGSEVPVTAFSKAVELVELPSYIHKTSGPSSVSKAEKETITDSAPDTMMAW
jgi:hypothetical protein